MKGVHKVIRFRYVAIKPVGDGELLRCDDTLFSSDVMCRCRERGGVWMRKNETDRIPAFAVWDAVCKFAGKKQKALKPKFQGFWSC